MNIFLITQTSSQSTKYCRSKFAAKKYVGKTFDIADFVDKLPESTELEFDGKNICVTNVDEEKNVTTFSLYKCVVKDNGWVRSSKRLHTEKVDAITVTKVEHIDNDKEKADNDKEKEGKDKEKDDKDDSYTTTSAPFVSVMSEMLQAIERKQPFCSRAEHATNVLKLYEYASDHIDEIFEHPRLCSVMKSKLLHFYHVDKEEQFLPVYEKMFGPMPATYTLD